MLFNPIPTKSDRDPNPKMNSLPTPEPVCGNSSLLLSSLFSKSSLFSSSSLSSSGLRGLSSLLSSIENSEITYFCLKHLPFSSISSELVISMLVNSALSIALNSKMK